MFFYFNLCSFIFFSPYILESFYSLFLNEKLYYAFFIYIGPIIVRIPQLLFLNEKLYYVFFFFFFFFFFAIIVIFNYINFFHFFIFISGAYVFPFFVLDPYFFLSNLYIIFYSNDYFLFCKFYIEFRK
jgi:hypothetical protein